MKIFSTYIINESFKSDLISFLNKLKIKIESIKNTNLQFLNELKELQFIKEFKEILKNKTPEEKQKYLQWCKEISIEIIIILIDILKKNPETRLKISIIKSFIIVQLSKIIKYYDKHKFEIDLIINIILSEFVKYIKKNNVDRINESVDDTTILFENK